MPNFKQTGLVLLISVVALSICACNGGGGGAVLPNPNPNPGGTQQPLPGQQPLPQQQAAPPDTTTVIAVFNDQKMEFSMGSGVNAVLPNASVIIEDPQNFVANTTATPDGAFEFFQADVPPNFMTAPGTQIKVYQFDANTLRSEAAYVTIQLVSIP